MKGPSSQQPDVIIVGAGIMGCATALELARLNYAVRVLDANQEAGAGSTSFSVANIRFHYSTLEGVLASWECKHIWDHWLEYLGHRDEQGLARLHPLGLLRLDPKDNDRRRVVLKLFDEVEVPYSELDGDNIREQFPALDLGRYGPAVPVGDANFWPPATEEVAGYLTPDCGFVSPPQLATHNLMASAQQAGARFAFGVQVTEVVARGDRVIGVILSNGDRLEAPIVLNAAGPHSCRVNHIAGLDDDFKTVWTRPLRQEVHAVPAPANFTLEAGGVIVDDGDLSTWFRPHLDGTVLIGGTEPECDPMEWITDADVYEPAATLRGWEAQVFRTGQRLPGLRVMPRPTGLGALYDATPDWIPIYDRTSLNGFYVAIGTSGNQFKNGPLVGIMMANLINAVENGADHDQEPVQVRGSFTGRDIDLGHYSRLRSVRAGMNVLG